VEELVTDQRYPNERRNGHVPREAERGSVAHQRYSTDDESQTKCPVSTEEVLRVSGIRRSETIARAEARAKSSG
jgi:hypothetical protein